MSREMGEIYDVQELAEFFKVSPRTIESWCEEGRLPGFKIGKEWRVRIEDLQKLISGKIKAQRSDKGGMF